MRNLINDRRIAMSEYCVEKEGDDQWDVFEHYDDGPDPYPSDREDKSQEERNKEIDEGDREWRKA
jgi:hypothetical protein